MTRGSDRGSERSAKVRRSAPARVPITLLALFLAPRAADGNPAPGRVSMDGISLAPPPGWVLVGEEDRDGAPRGSEELEGSTEAAWVSARGEPRGSLCVLVSDEPIAVTRGGLQRARATLEASVRALPEITSFRVREATVGELDGLPAYRFDAVLESGRGASAQIVYVAGSDRTVVVTLCADRSDEERLRDLADSTLRSVRIEHPRLLGALSSPWLWGGAAGWVLAAALRRRARAGPRASRPKQRR